MSQNYVNMLRVQVENLVSFVEEKSGNWQPVFLCLSASELLMDTEFPWSHGTGMFSYFNGPSPSLSITWWEAEENPKNLTSQDKSVEWIVDICGLVSSWLPIAGHVFVSKAH